MPGQILTVMLILCPDDERGIAMKLRATLTIGKTYDRLTFPLSETRCNDHGAIELLHQPVHLRNTLSQIQAALSVFVTTL